MLARIYGVVYAPQDRLVAWFVERRLRGASKEQRLAYHDRATLMVVANYGFSTQFLVLGICLALGRPEAYLWVVVACALSLVPLELAARAACPRVAWVLRWRLPSPRATSLTT